MNNSFTINLMEYLYKVIDIKDDSNHVNASDVRENDFICQQIIRSRQDIARFTFFLNNLFQTQICLLFNIKNYR